MRAAIVGNLGVGRIVAEIWDERTDALLNPTEHGLPFEVS
jgi:hypothetical protein